MRQIVGCTVAIALGLVMPTLAQEDNVLFLNARQARQHVLGDMENRTCVVPKIWVNPERSCPDYAPNVPFSIHGRRIQVDKSSEQLLDEGYFIQGRRIDLQVVNRQFFTDYSITIDAVTQIQTGPNIRNLNEAENLTVGPASFATIPSSKGGTEGLTSRTAAQIVHQFIDEETSSQPLADLNNDHAVIERESARILAQIEDFYEHYDLVLGNAPPPADHRCPAVTGDPRVIPLRVCLDDELSTESTGAWLAPPFRDEQEFRNVNTRVQDLIVAVNTLAKTLANTDLPAKLKSLDGAMAQYDNDIVIFNGNIDAAVDAAVLVQTLDDGFRGDMRRQEMKVLLLDKLKGPDSKPTLDEAEMNELLDRYRSTSAITRARANELAARARDLTPELMISDAFLSGIHARLSGFRSNMNVDLSDAIGGLNDSQSKLLNRVNYIYDHSEVSDPFPKQIDLSGHSGNLVVYYTIRRIENFQRYTVAQVQGPGSNAQATLAGTPLPPAKGAGGTGATTQPTATTVNPASPSTPQANTPANGSPSGSGQAPADSNQGIVVAKGSFEVHDVFHANVVAAIAFSTLKDQTITKQAQPQSCTGTSTTPDSNCFAPLLNSSSYKWAPIVGLDYYLHPRDTFPRARGQRWECSDDWKQCIGFMGAASAVKANNYFLGFFFEPKLGVQIATGANFGTKAVLDSNYKFGTPVDITGDFPTHDARGTGAFLSVGLDLGIFRKIFGKFTGIGTAASSTSGQ